MLFRTLSATDGCDGGLVVQSWRRGPLGWASGGFAREGVRPKASQSANDFLIELPERDTRGIAAPLWGRGASRGRGVRREAACAALGGVAGIARLSPMS